VDAEGLKFLVRVRQHCHRLSLLRGRLKGNGGRHDRQITTRPKRN
jgi:hypothetical protein